MTTPAWCNKTNAVLAITVTASAISLVCGWHLSDMPLAAGGMAGMAYVLLRWDGKRRERLKNQSRTSRWKPPASSPGPVRAARQPADPNDLDAVVRQMLEQGRYALLLRPQIVANLSEQHFCRTLETLQDAMALVPDGDVALGQIDDAPGDGKVDVNEILARRGRVVQVDRFFLDRSPVTNEEFYEFVAAGGYQQVTLWDPTVLPAVLDFVDQTGQPGPRFWSGGCYDAAKARHPVVGVSWYEAQAYARWVGKRLPTDAEWVKAGSWPVKVSTDTRLQRRYPWGDTMDRAKANLWSSGRKGTVSVDEYAEGASVGGVYQLIGNVWEWTRGNYSPRDTQGEELAMEVAMKSIRGGSFDTYFENQATCQFQSGESALARKANIGFRCAVGVCDLVLARATEQGSIEAETEVEPLEEVEV